MLAYHGKPPEILQRAITLDLVVEGFRNMEALRVGSSRKYVREIDAKVQKDDLFVLCGNYYWNMESLTKHKREKPHHVFLLFVLLFIQWVVLRPPV